MTDDFYSDCKSTSSSRGVGMNIPVPRTYESKPMLENINDGSPSPRANRVADDNQQSNQGTNNSSGKKLLLDRMRSAEDHKFIRGGQNSSPKQMESGAAYDEQDDRQEGPTFRPGQMIDLWKNL